MIVIARKGRIPAPVEQVWEVVRRAEALPTWLTGVRQVSTQGPEGFGRLLRLTSMAEADEVEREVEIIAYKPPTLLAWRCVGARRVNGEPPTGDRRTNKQRRIGRWDLKGPTELHIQLHPVQPSQGWSGPVGPRPGWADTQVLLYAVCPAGGLECLRLRWGPARRWRAELTRSVSTLSGLFPASVGAN